MFCSSHRILWAGVLFLVVLARGIITAQAPAKTVWDGAYTDAQAERAQGTFSASCSRCHTLTPDGARADDATVGDPEEPGRWSAINSGRPIHRRPWATC